jgi:hypothetical protein
MWHGDVSFATLACLCVYYTVIKNHVIILYINICDLMLYMKHVK